MNRLLEAKFPEAPEGTAYKHAWTYGSGWEKDIFLKQIFSLMSYAYKSYLNIKPLDLVKKMKSHGKTDDGKNRGY